jgi:hypothetical protein
MTFQGVAISRYPTKHCNIFFVIQNVLFFNSSSADVNSGAFVIFKRSQYNTIQYNTNICIAPYIKISLRRLTYNMDKTKNRSRYIKIHIENPLKLL